MRTCSSFTQLVHITQINTGFKFTADWFRDAPVVFGDLKKSSKDACASLPVTIITQNCYRWYYMYSDFLCISCSKSFLD